MKLILVTNGTGSFGKMFVFIILAKLDPPFDDTAIDFLGEISVPAHKIASLVLVNMEFRKELAATENL